MNFFPVNRQTQLIKRSRASGSSQHGRCGLSDHLPRVSRSISQSISESLCPSTDSRRSECLTASRPARSGPARVLAPRPLVSSGCCRCSPAGSRQGAPDQLHPRFDCSLIRQVKGTGRIPRRGLQSSHRRQSRLDQQSQLVVEADSRYLVRRSNVCASENGDACFMQLPNDRETLLELHPGVLLGVWPPSALPNLYVRRRNVLEPVHTRDERALPATLEAISIQR